MISSLQVNESFYGKNWKMLAIWGVVLSLLGLFAISTTLYTTLMTVIFLGVLIATAGVVIVLNAFGFWRVSKKTMFINLLIGILYVAVGAMLIKNPVATSISLTLILGVMYVLAGAFRISYALVHRTLRWTLMLLNGVFSLLIGILILLNWPLSGLYIIGLFVGIDLLICGWVYLMTAFAGRQLVHS